ncbi:NAD(P)/FAD-dependent oxidoreductase [Leptothermofonsia sp. ETS-13]|uniref:NAD(P)/FAD-dependent oxidoreductase n=1 Tax=Leptothermofonsia sp. ETS-13 TaxID=3035696 RepID=UPI003BA0EF61
MVKRPRVVIVGAGFGGLQAAQSLAGAGADVLLIDRNNYHTFVPLLYQVATAQLAPEQVVYPVRTILRKASNIQFRLAEVQRVDFSAQFVETEDAVIPYDYLVLATGSQTQFLGVPGATEHAFSMKTLEEAVALRNHIFACFEQAAHESDALRRQQLLTIVIVGGGPTGVEMAGALVEVLRGRLRQDYPTLDWRQVRLVLVQAGDRPLADLPKKLGVYTCQRLCQLGVEVYLQTRVKRVTPGAVHLQDQTILTETVIWTAGLEASPPETSDELSRATKGKLLVRPTLQLLEQSNVYAIGDLAYVRQNGVPLTGVAPEALQQGVTVARNIRLQLQGRAPKPFNYFNKGRLAIIGCFSGVGKIGVFAFTGFLPWLMWLGVHLVYLPGYRNRLLVFITWLHSYLLGDRAIPIIFAPSRTAVRKRVTLQEAMLDTAGDRQKGGDEG